MCPPDKGAKPDPVKAAALARGIPVHQFPIAQDARGARARSTARAPTSALLAYVTQIVPEPLLDVPRLGDALLPSVAAAALPRRQRHPLAAHPRRDAHRRARSSGPTPASTRVRSSCSARRPSIPTTPPGTLYYQTLFPLGVQACLDAVALVRERQARRASRRTRRLATYDPLLTDAHAAIDWAQPARSASTT